MSEEIDNIRNIAILQANYVNMNNIIVELKEYMRNSSASRAANHNEVIQRLAVIETKQDEFKEYQETCDHERETLSADVLKLKLNESRQAGKASVWAVVSATITSGGIAILSAIYERLHT